MTKKEEPKLYYIVDKATGKTLVRDGSSSLSSAVRHVVRWKALGYDVKVVDQYGKVYYGG